jgi:hypothetical protein
MRCVYIAILFEEKGVASGSGEERREFESREV